MFRPVRKKNNCISDEAAKALLRTARRGVFAVNGEDGYPYAIPINYYYDEPAQKIYFHSARAGYKIDALRASDKVCFTVYGNERVEDEVWAPFVQSTVVFGRARLMPPGPECEQAMKRFALKYFPEAFADQVIAKSGRAAQMVEITIEHLSGKQVQER